MKTQLWVLLLSFGLVACSEEVLDYRNAEIVNKQIYAQGANSSFTGKITNVPFSLIQAKEFGTIFKLYEAATGDTQLGSALLISGVHALGNVQQNNSLLLCDVEVSKGIFDGEASCHLNGKEATIMKYKYSKGKLDGILTLNMPKNKDEEVVKVVEAQMGSGTLNGKVTIWSARTGKQVYEITMENGVPNGTGIRNGANGKKFLHEIYENGILVKKVYFNPSTGEEIGSVTVDEYQREIDGISVTYHFRENGILIDEPKILDVFDKPNEKLIQYDPETGKILSEITYKDGSPFNGLYYSRGPNGSVKYPPEEYINGERKSEIEERKRLEAEEEEKKKIEQEEEAQSKKVEEESQNAMRDCIKRLENDENFSGYAMDVLELECQQELNGMIQ